MQRDKSIDLLKGIGIFLVVIGHSGCPDIFHRVIYGFHMPLFFMASGYLFNTASLTKKWNFIRRKVLGLYFPYIFWSLVFLLLHNVFLRIGLLSEIYGDVNGNVTYIFGAQEMGERAMRIVLTMYGHDGFLLGAYWFMRVIFLSSILFCVSLWTVSKLTRNTQKASCVSLFFLVSAGVIAYTHISIPHLPQGGYRELMGVFFISSGFVVKEKNISVKNVFLPLLLLYLALTILFPTEMSPYASLQECVVLSITGIIGTLCLIQICIQLSTLNNSYTSKFLGKAFFRYPDIPYSDV